MLCFFNDSCVGSVQSRPVKAAGAEVGAQRRNQKLHAAVAKSTFGSENAKKLTVSEHFLKLWCRKIARRCGEKHIWKWKCTKHVRSEALFGVLMSTKLHELVTKTTFWSKNVQNTSVSEHFSNIWCAKIARPCGEKHFLKSKCTKHVSSGQFFEVLMSKN